MKKRIVSCCGTLLALISLEGCVHLNSVSMTQVPEARNYKVTAESSRMIILGLNFDNDYVDQVSDALKGKCPGGQIKGILTKDETVNYFLFLVAKRRVMAEGYCSKTPGGNA